MVASQGANLAQTRRAQRHGWSCWLRWVTQWDHIPPIHRAKWEEAWRPRDHRPAQWRLLQDVSKALEWRRVKEMGEGSASSEVRLFWMLTDWLNSNFYTALIASLQLSSSPLFSNLVLNWLTKFSLDSLKLFQYVVAIIVATRLVIFAILAALRVWTFRVAVRLFIWYRPFVRFRWTVFLLWLGHFSFIQSVFLFCYFYAFHLFQILFKFCYLCFSLFFRRL